ncbi:hypothetical protein GCM10022408_22160 [Hymenobacter fastidiosus]|uniref:Uncharacterized protein n=1 Tax=Hymenobacter fastidiosus TaxID=486264 RepID=A0ABP7SC22_9BACT
MTLRLVLAALLLTGANVAPAQTPGSLPSETFKQHLRARYARSDTAQALITLYAHRQVGGVSWLAGGTLAALRLATSGGRTVASGPGYSVREEAPGLGIALLAASPFLAYGLLKLYRYSNAHLAQVLTDYAAGKPLTRGMQRKAGRLLDTPIINYQPVNAAPAGR